MSLTASIAACAVVIGVLVTVTAVGVARIEAAHPPAGQFIVVEGVRLHVAELFRSSRLCVKPAQDQKSNASERPHAPGVSLLRLSSRSEAGRYGV
jgi:hypothetical protein